MTQPSNLTSALATALTAVHDDLIAELPPGAYASITAAWSPELGAPLTTLTLTTHDLDDEDEDDADGQEEL